MAGDTTTGIVEEVLTLINGLIGMISGAQSSILTRTLDEVTAVGEQVSNLGDNLVTSVREISDQVETSRSNIVSHISTAVDQINVHSDENTSQILTTLNQNQNEILQQLAVMDQALQDIGTKVADAVANALTTVVNSISDLETKLVNAQTEAINNLASTIDNAIRDQTDIVTLAIDHAALAIDNQTAIIGETRDVLHNELEQLNSTLSDGLRLLGNTIDSAIRQSAFGISLAIGAEAVAVGVGDAVVAGAIAVGCTEIAGAIAASQAANKLLFAGKIAKDLEVADKVIEILSLISAVVALSDPDLIAQAIQPVIDSYMNLGKSITPHITSQGGA